MLVPFVIDADSLAPDPAWTPAHQTSIHKSLLDTWKRIGLLIHDGESFEGSRLKQAIDALPQKLAPLWQELLKRLPMISGPDGWNGVIFNSRDCLDVIGAAARVALVDDTKAEVDFGLDEGQLSFSLIGHNNLEVCRIVAAQHAEIFASAIALSGQHIPAKQTYQGLWRTRFAALAKAPSKNISIVDRYAISQHFECPQIYLSGLARFICLLGADASGKRYLMLFSAWTPELNQRNITLQEVADELRHVLLHHGNGLVKSVKLVMLPNPVFGDLHHDRFIRFGEFVWDIGIGVKIFEGPCSAETSTASFKMCLLAPTYKGAEITLSQRAQARSTEVRI